MSLVASYAGFWREEPRARAFLVASLVDDLGIAVSAWASTLMMVSLADTQRARATIMLPTLLVIAWPGASPQPAPRPRSCPSRPRSASIAGDMLAQVLATLAEERWGIPGLIVRAGTLQVVLVALIATAGGRRLWNFGLRGEDPETESAGLAPKRAA